MIGSELYGIFRFGSQLFKAFFYEGEIKKASFMVIETRFYGTLHCEILVMKGNHRVDVCVFKVFEIVFERFDEIRVMNSEIYDSCWSSLRRFDSVVERELKFFGGLLCGCGLIVGNCLRKDILCLREASFVSQ